VTSKTVINLRIFGLAFCVVTEVVSKDGP